MDQKVQSHPPFDVVIDEPLFLNNRTYIPEPPMENGRRDIWYNTTLIPYSIADTTYTFMVPLPKRIKKPQILKDLFSCFPGYEPLVFVDDPFDFNFFKNSVFCSSPAIEDASYIQWLDRVQEKKKHFRSDLGIIELIQLSRVGPKYNSHMLIIAMCFWVSSTNTFHLPCGMITPHLLTLLLSLAFDQLEKHLSLQPRQEQIMGFVTPRLK